MIENPYRRKTAVVLLSVAAIIVAGVNTVMRHGVTPAQAAPKMPASPVPAGPTFLFLSDIHLNDTAHTTHYGGDTGKDLWKLFKEKVNEVLGGPNSPDFIVYTGDLSAHYRCSGTCYLEPDQRGAHNRDLSAILSEFQALAKKYNKPFFYLPGNNDAVAGNYYSFADKEQHTALDLVPAQNLFFPQPAGVADANAAHMISFPKPFMGFYSAQVMKGLRLIAMNTVIYTPKYTAVDGSTQLAEGNKQLQWLADQLADAAANNEKVYIAMHVPPGVDAYSGKDMWKAQVSGSANWQNTFLRLTEQYQATIAGILYGHTHTDEVRRLYDSTGTRITEVAISSPGVTPNHFNNPGFKVVRYDAGSKELLDFTTYYTIVGKPAWGNNTYTFTDAYGAGSSIYSRLSSMTLSAAGNSMSKIYTVKNLFAPYNTTRGIEVKRQ
jgi:sphingomyelin phosphodiesterase acid-like 3